MRSNHTHSIITQLQLSGSFIRHLKGQRQNANSSKKKKKKKKKKGRFKSLLAMIKTHADSDDSLPSAGRVFVHEGPLAHPPTHVRLPSPKVHP
jgi:hypothetical protein